MTAPTHAPRRAVRRVDSLAGMDASSNAPPRAGNRPSPTLGGPSERRLPAAGRTVAAPGPAARRRRLRASFDNRPPDGVKGRQAITPNPSPAFYGVRVSARDHVWKAGNL
ncbi:hypothetical protein TNCT6_62160 [Streptomyces sp. 6-11-2]|nr:hypothetical protein TNCT6_62160 [Streptomyces sp. 6-11-2]